MTIQESLIPANAMLRWVRAFTGISSGFESVTWSCAWPSLVACYFSLLPSTLQALFALRLAAITLTTSIRVAYFCAEFQHCTAESLATAAEVQRIFFPGVVLATFSNSVAIADTVFFSAPILPKPPAALDRTATDLSQILGVESRILLGRNKS